MREQGRKESTENGKARTPGDYELGVFRGFRALWDVFVVVMSVFWM